VLSEAVLVILIDHPPPSEFAVFSEIGAHLDFDYRFAEQRFAEHEHDWAEVGPIVARKWANRRHRRVGVNGHLFSSPLASSVKRPVDPDGWILRRFRTQFAEVAVPRANLCSIRRERRRAAGT
jgi:hypothetical protein